MLIWALAAADMGLTSIKRKVSQILFSVRLSLLVVERPCTCKSSVI